MPNRLDGSPDESEIYPPAPAMTADERRFLRDQGVPEAEIRALEEARRRPVRPSPDGTPDGR